MKSEIRFSRENAPSIWHIFSYFSHHLKPHRKDLFKAAFCMFGLTLMELIRPWPLKIIFDGLLIPQPKTTAWIEKYTPFLTNPDSLLAFMAGSILIIAILSGLFGFGQSYLTSSVGQRVVATVRYQLYRHIHQLSHSFHDESSLGDLIARLTGDIRMMREMLVTSVIFISNRSLTLLGMFGIMIWLDWKLTLIAIAIVPILIFTVSLFNREIKKATKRQRRKESHITSVMTERLSAISLVQAYAREAFEEAEFSKQVENSLHAELRSTRLEAHLNRIVQILLATGTAGVLWFGVSQVKSGLISPGDLLVFIAYLSSLYKPIRKLSSLTGRISKATVCGERIISILETEPAIKDKPNAVSANEIRGDILFNHVSFGYSLKRKALNNISFHIHPGETAALLGQSGSGKSTIAKLLLRFYDPDTGEIIIDGRNIGNYQLESLRQQVAVVLQDPYLFSATIRDNISYGKLDATDEEIMNSAKSANAHDFIVHLPEGYDTIISERGKSLSGGQQQRIAIARAMIRHAPIVILDEPTSGLDSENKGEIESALKNLTKNTTCFLITHDIQTARIADRFFIFHAGEFEEVDRNTADRFLQARNHKSDSHKEFSYFQNAI